mmetsp:Transcript_26377/g.77991  ORF Transcript_26377/g.77991 Transcript_26377/m.77991 type:complete len:262 (+) Transcript_26377:579-1364(+)
MSRMTSTLAVRWTARPRSRRKRRLPRRRLWRPRFPRCPRSYNGRASHRASPSCPQPPRILLHPCHRRRPTLASSSESAWRAASSPQSWKRRLSTPMPPAAAPPLPPRSGRIAICARWGPSCTNSSPGRGRSGSRRMNALAWTLWQKRKRTTTAAATAARGAGGGRRAAAVAPVTAGEGSATRRSGRWVSRRPCAGSSPTCWTRKSAPTVYICRGRRSSGTWDCLRPNPTASSSIPPPLLRTRTDFTDWTFRTTLLTAARMR